MPLSWNAALQQLVSLVFTRCAAAVWPTHRDQPAVQMLSCNLRQCLQRPCCQRKQVAERPDRRPQSACIYSCKLPAHAFSSSGSSHRHDTVGQPLTIEGLDGIRPQTHMMKVESSTDSLLVTKAGRSCTHTDRMTMRSTQPDFACCSAASQQARAVSPLGRLRAPAAPLSHPHGCRMQRGRSCRDAQAALSPSCSCRPFGLMYITKQ